ncbi:hypothetical protein EZS27_019688 [termite gut metagenome]|jgi:hypothetical protein|uniref:Uncharacterized protein n=1 Tax=termite gut metagenome TaxID=433724 RepID=A0A5J4REX9_9ZZZZ
MGKSPSPKDNHANQLNANKGFKGENKQFAQAQGNRGKQIMQSKSTKNK